MAEQVLIVGATSGIAEALCQLMAQRGCRLILAARNVEHCQKLANELRAKYHVDCPIEAFDAIDFAGQPAFFERCVAQAGGQLDGLVLCHGYLPHQEQALADPAESRRTIDINFTSPVTLLNHAAEYFAARKAGYLAVISSVAGERGRQSNFIYGATKAGFSVYLQGLRNRLHFAGVHVLTIKPGYVLTSMIADRSGARSRLVATPQRVARDIDRAIRRCRNVLYTPWFWQPIMAIVRAVPESIFKRLRT